MVTPLLRLLSPSFLFLKPIIKQSPFTSVVVVVTYSSLPSIFREYELLCVKYTVATDVTFTEEKASSLPAGPFH